MGAFEFTALDPAGRDQKGVLEGDTPRQVRQQLRDRGWTPLAVQEVAQREARAAGSRFQLRRGISAADLALLTRQLATLVRSGFPIEESLRTVARQTEKPRLRSLLTAVRSRVVEGHSLASGLAEFPHAFPELYRTTVEAGEHSGHLEAVLDRLADYTESRHELQQKLQQVMVYPVLLTIMALGITALLLTYVVPQVVQVFDNVGQELPLLTRVLIAMSEFMQAWGLALLVGLVALVAGLRYLLRQAAPRRVFHGLLLRTPFVSRLVRGLNTARFARTLSILTASGVPVLESLRIAGSVMTNVPMREAVDAAARRVREGSSISGSLEKSGYFPPMTLHLIASGETSGNLEDMLERAALNQEREMQTLIGSIMAAVEPLILVVMGLIVLLIVMAILVPIFDFNQLVA
jgi:general secretion pathway protein F